MQRRCLSTTPSFLGKGCTVDLRYLQLVSFEFFLFLNFLIFFLQAKYQPIGKWSWQSDLGLRTRRCRAHGGPALAPWEEISIWKTPHRVPSTDSAKQAGSTGEDAPWSVLFSLESVFWKGPFPEAGGYGQESWLGHGPWSCPMTLFSSFCPFVRAKHQCWDSAGPPFCV